jgi:hypothetical protein
VAAIAERLLEHAPNLPITRADRKNRTGLARNGRRVAESGRRSGFLSRDRRPHQRGLRRQFQRVGRAARHAQLNSCASNVTVVNIDNGFGAGYVASLINRL